MTAPPRELSTKDLVDMILFSSTAGRRELQSSPILGDVWLEYAENPTEAVDLLITPQYGVPAGPLAKEISARLGRSPARGREKTGRGAGGATDARVAYLQGLIAAHLTFSQVIEQILPTTRWWKDRLRDWWELQKKPHRPADADPGAVISNLVTWATCDSEDDRLAAMKKLARSPELLRMLVLTVLILWGEEKSERGGKNPGVIGLLRTRSAASEMKLRLNAVLDGLQVPDLKDEGSASREAPMGLDKDLPWIFLISLNREVSPALRESVPAVKGDAARHLFDVRCDKIVWAILDSGIDGRHPAFHDPIDSTSSGTVPEGRCRIIKALDFGYIREILSIDSDPDDEKSLDQRVDAILKHRQVHPMKMKKWRQKTKESLRKLIRDSENDRPLLWQEVESLIEIDPQLDPPETDHGTHVAGILAANAQGVRRVDPENPQSDIQQNPKLAQQGLCPDIQLYDLRVLGRTEAETEFAVIAALQYIRHLNERLGFRQIHGANLSLQMPHNVRNWACGQTPVCIECENLINSGVVVVAAAGNFGYQRLQTEHGMYDGYVPLSITDPGNADGVITVGATHRFWPHTYGVSFFSSRGPTGDGRLKPDLVAPGERITSCLKLEDEEIPRWGEMDGTSMAAPHVSGAAAMLLARYTELQGRPRVVKEVLCSTATDLARERNFQGHGMLDILRAFQKR